MKKIQGDRLFDGLQFLENNPVVIIDSNKIVDIVDQENAGNDVLKVNGILCPAFVNTHCHLELSHLKNTIPPYTGMGNFLQKVVCERNNFTEDEIRYQIESEDQKMYQAGIAVVGDICNQKHTIAIKKKSKIKYHSFIEILGLYPSIIVQKYYEGIALRETFMKENLEATLVPHAPYSLCMELFQKIGNTLQNPIISMHYHESQDEIEWIEKKAGGIKKFYDFLKFTVPSDIVVSRNEWVKAFTQNNSFIAVHNVVATEEDIYTLQQFFKLQNTNLFLCICPKANEYIQQKKPPYFLLEKYRDILCIGTDSLASNDELSILSELQLIQQHYPQIPISHLLKAATFNGAKALNKEHTFGTIQKGKSNQFIVLQNLKDEKLSHTIVKRIEAFL